MRRDHTPVQAFIVSSPASSSETKASPGREAPAAPAGRKARYDRTLHLASQPPGPMPRGAPVSPVLHAEIPAPLEPPASSERTPRETHGTAMALGHPPAAPAALARRPSAGGPIDRFFARLAAWLEGLVARFAR